MLCYSRDAIASKNIVDGICQIFDDSAVLQNIVFSAF